MTKIKLISDFDGIWTNQNLEAEYVWNYIMNSLSELTGFDPEKIQNILSECKNEMNKEPYKYGWYNNGKVAAYFYEDPFGDNNAIFDYINKTASEKSDNEFYKNLKTVKESILRKYSSLADFSQECFMKSTTQFKSEGKLNPVDTMKKVVDDLNSSGVEIIVASNSKTEKIKYLFSKAGIDVTDETSGQRNAVHARGDARKFVIDNDYHDLPEYLDVTDKFLVPLRRSSYHKILSEEKPDYVIGDVFSLDIALPLYLRLNDSSFGNLKVIQRVQPYTPDWVKDFLSKDEFIGIAFLVDSVDEVPDLISKVHN
ncbi:MAG: hypothetical protein IPL53_09140 [Ignavibacteria bacterium]|nr:hypothetical protein [Ignavibacteria bacterium]